MGFKLLGAYGLLAPLANIGKCADDLIAQGYHGASVITDNRWVQPPEPENADFWWPWDAAAGVFDMTAHNDRAFKRFRLLCETFATKKLALFIKFQSVYYRNSWNKFPAMKCKMHPYTKNNFGVVFDDPRVLYDSITFAPLKYHWLKWDIINEPQNKYKFFQANAIGGAIMKAYKRLIRIVADVKTKNPDWVFGYAPNNEEIAGKLGDRSEIHSWFHDCFVAKGLDTDVTGFYRVVNRQGNPQQMTQIHADLGRKYGVKFGLGALHEVHVDGKNDPVLTGLVKSRTFASTDGAPEDSNFIKANQELAKAGYFIFDAKYAESLSGTTPKPPYRWQSNWDNCIAEHGKILE